MQGTPRPPPNRSGCASRRQSSPGPTSRSPARECARTGCIPSATTWKWAPVRDQGRFSPSSRPPARGSPPTSRSRSSSRPHARAGHRRATSPKADTNRPCDLLEPSSESGRDRPSCPRSRPGEKREQAGHPGGRPPFASPPRGARSGRSKQSRTRPRRPAVIGIAALAAVIAVGVAINPTSSSRTAPHRAAVSPDRRDAVAGEVTRIAARP